MKNINPSDFSDYRREMFDIFSKCDFELILLNQSRFYHLGTMEEYIEHFNIHEDFRKELGLLQNCSTNIAIGSNSTSGTSIESYVTKDNLVTFRSRKTVIEYCIIE